MVPIPGCLTVQEFSQDEISIESNEKGRNISNAHALLNKRQIKNAYGLMSSSKPWIKGTTKIK